MNLLFFVCLVPLVLAWPRQDGDEDGGERRGMGRWQSDDRGDMSEKHGQGKIGFFKMVGKLSMAKGGKGRRYNDEDEKPMMMHNGGDSHEEGEGGRMSGRRNGGRGDGRGHGKQWGKRTESNEDKDEHRGKGKWSRGDMGDDEDEEGQRRWRKDSREESEERWMGHRRDSGRGDGRGHGKQWGKRIESDEDKDEHRGKGKWSRGDMGDDEDEEGHRRWGYMVHGKRGMGKPMVGENSSEEHIKRAYVKFFGKVTMMKGKQAEGDWKHGGDDHEKRRHLGGKRYEDNDDEDSEEADEKMNMSDRSDKMAEQKLKMAMKKLYKNHPHQLAKILTLSFLRMCECDGDDETRLLKQFLDNADMSEDKEKSDAKKVKLPEIPDFGTNTTAKVEFLRNLSKQQQELLFGYDLVKNMCNGAKAYLKKSKEFYEKYFPMKDDDTSKYTTEMTP